MIDHVSDSARWSGMLLLLVVTRAVEASQMLFDSPLPLFPRYSLLQSSNQGRGPPGLLKEPIGWVQAENAI